MLLNTRAKAYNLAHAYIIFKDGLEQIRPTRHFRCYYNCRYLVGSGCLAIYKNEYANNGRSCTVRENHFENLLLNGLSTQYRNTQKVIIETIC